jgi:G6PDH family F420-dependent oxidoreductase
MKIGFFLSSEEYGPRDLVAQAGAAEEAGFKDLWISDHYHPWTDAQGQSAFVWSVIGALAEATENMHVTTGVTCPTVRIHPAVIAQAAATSKVMLEGRFTLGVGTGEALNEHILGDHWPEADVRIEMLEEAVEVMRNLWQGGQQSHYGKHYTLENARIYTLPDEPPDIYVSGFGPKATKVAGQIGDGFCTVAPDADGIKLFKESGGDGKPVQAGMKACYHADEDEAVKTALRIWPNDAAPGELAQVLPTPSHFEQVADLVTEEHIREQTPCGPDIDRHLESIQEFADAGVDELYVQQIGGNHDEFFRAYSKEILPKFNE